MHSKTVIFETKDKSLDYVTACKNMHIHIVAPRSSPVKEAFIYPEDEGANHTFILERKTSMYINDRVAKEFRTLQADVKSSGTVNNVLGWYQERKAQFPILVQFSNIIFVIMPSQDKNEREFYLASVFTGVRHASMFIGMLSKLIFINNHSIGIHTNQNISVSQETIEYINKVTDLMG